MGQLLAMPRKQEQQEDHNLFEQEFVGQASELRKQEQHDRLMQRAREVAEMLDKLDGLLTVDRERAISMLAEYTGLLELAVEDIRMVRDIDESFGGHPRRPSQVARLALKLERGISYLLGIFCVVSNSENLSVYNWKLVHRDVQEVQTTSNRLVLLNNSEEPKIAA